MRINRTKRRVRQPRHRIWCYQRGSKGAKNLARALGIKVLKHEGSTFRARPMDTVINWGDSNYPEHLRSATVYNAQLSTCTNKLVFFRAMSASANPPRVPDWGTTREWAAAKVAAGRRVCARTILTGHSGAGIIIIGPGQEIPNAQLYTEYVPKEAEFRVHIFRGEVVDVQRKIRDPNREPTDWHVRSHTNGFIYVRGGVVPHQDVIEQAKRAFACSSLDFGAVDVLWNAKRSQAYVLEINTAPGITGQTVNNYATALRGLFNAVQR